MSLSLTYFNSKFWLILNEIPIQVALDKTNKQKDLLFNTTEES